VTLPLAGGASHPINDTTNGSNSSVRPLRRTRRLSAEIRAFFGDSGAAVLAGMSPLACTHREWPRLCGSTRQAAGARPRAGYTQFVLAVTLPALRPAKRGAAARPPSARIFPVRCDLGIGHQLGRELGPYDLTQTNYSRFSTVAGTRWDNDLTFLAATGPGFAPRAKRRIRRGQTRYACCKAGSTQSTTTFPRAPR
jgi:hypothetical protein